MSTAVIVLTLIKSLNEETFAHSGVPPATETLAAQFFVGKCWIYM